MKKIKLINFLKEEKREEKYFKCTLIILVYLLLFQCYSHIQNIKDLNEEIKNNKSLIQSGKMVNTENKNRKSTLIKDSNKIYDILGFENVDRLSVENNKVEIEGQCKSLDILDNIKNMNNIKNFSVTNVESKKNKFYFQAIYEIGGFE